MDNLGAAGASSANAQTGPVQFWYYGQGPGTSGAPPATQCTSPATSTTAIGACPGTYNLPAGQVLAYVVSTGASTPGSSPVAVLDSRGAGFYGYVIAQAGFQYCHAFAYLSALNQGATGNGISEGYVGLILDQNIGGLPPRTGNPAEILGQ
jgi:hypothetical protein